MDGHAAHEGIDGYAERNPRLTDAAVVLALLLGAALGVSLAGPGDGPAADRWTGGAIAALACLPLLRGRAHPRVAVLVTTACAVILGVLDYLLTPLLLAPLMVALYWLAATGTPRTAWAYGAVAIVPVVATAVGTDNFDDMVALRALGPALWLLLPLAMGSRTRLRHAWLDAVQARAEHAERTREEEARLRVAEERIRIARDLHDIVAHHMAVANAQAGTAAHFLETNPDLTRRMLRDLQSTTSTAMLELRDTVGVLRQAGPDVDSLEPAPALKPPPEPKPGPKPPPEPKPGLKPGLKPPPGPKPSPGTEGTRSAGPDADSLQPPPGLNQLPRLLEATRSAGLEVEVAVEGERRDLPAGVDLTAYRIIQEALTNATKYAAGGTAALVLRYTRMELIITVSNERRADQPERGRGFGIMGMRERARAIGGALSVRDTDGERFEVTTTLPAAP
ncbi:sensor histidine kinase [Dactylosporangium sp. CS-033363]|uniref:sensor histidine kinase n=1 Tax=Dactylosporangium sp. CS-033363 TaxID=3239935 RepID=UPI003D945182